MSKIVWPGRKTRSFLLLIAAAAVQSQPDSAGLSTSQWNVRSAAYAAQPQPCNRRATAAKTQPWFGGLKPRLYCRVVQPQLVSARLSTSMWTATVWQRRIAAAKTQPWLGGLRPRRLKPSLSLTVLDLTVVASTQPCN